MTTTTSSASFLAISLGLVLAGSSGVATAKQKHPTDAQLRACRDAVQQQSEYRHLPNAAFSVYPGTHKHSKVDWSVVWDGLNATGKCQVDEHGRVQEIKTLSSNHKGYKGKNQDSYNDGFYYDRHKGKWRDPAGKICHTCTPENGFPNHGKKDQEWKPKNKYERDMQKQLQHQLSDQDIRNLNKLDKR